MIRETTLGMPSEPVVLGLDIGARSIGWALVQDTDNGEPKILAAGVRVFEAGVDGDIETGRDSSRAAVRRMARQMRRQTARRVQRKRQLFSLLQGAGFLPAGSNDSVARDAAIKDLDKRLLASLPAEYGDQGQTARKLPYVLRAEALRRPLTPEELGRVFYHLGERRGFKSNRRTDRQADDVGVVKTAIAKMQADKGEKTLGQFFAEQDPTQARIRGRYLGRSDYEDEFNRIFDLQAPHHASLTAKFRRQLRRCLFWQRPLKSQKSLIGRCSLLETRRRCPMAHPVAQEFRLLQAVNHLAVIEADGEIRPLRENERMAVLAALREEGDLTFAAMRKRLGLKRNVRFNLEEGGEKKLPGNRTHKAMSDALGEEWTKLDEAAQTRLVGVVRGSEDAATLRGQIARLFPDLANHSAALESVALEDSMASHCKKVLADLVERMKDGMPYATARAAFEAQHNLGGATDPVDQLPPVRAVLPSMTNPAVIRTLTELRKVVNELVRLHGKPGMIRIELARDLKKPRQVRQKLSARMREREGERSAAAQQLHSAGITNPSRADIEKLLLAEECGWTCPYTGQSFGMHDLVGSHATVDVEHIFPRRYLDDSFANKTLCVATENRTVKMDRLPAEAYSGDGDRYRAILDRVRAFDSDLRDEKLRRFMADKVEDDFTSRQLIDTAYASREAAKYLGLLYGGIVDVRSDKRVRTSTGRLSGLLRSAWKLNGILGSVDHKKGRGEDHRHHAIDAVVVALSTDAIIKRVTDAASSYASRASGRWSVEVPEQDGLVEQVIDAVQAIVVSHRVDRRLAGGLHADSIYSPARLDADGRAFHSIRKPLTALTVADINEGRIIDPVVRGLVQDKYAEVSARIKKVKPSDVFADTAHLPLLPNRRGAPIPIKRVRIRVRHKAARIGDEPHRARHIMQDGDGLHHTVITVQRSGSVEKWVEHPASRLEVKKRQGQGSDVIQKRWGNDEEYVLHLCKGDSVELTAEDGSRQIYVVRGVAERDIKVSLAWDPSKDRTKDKRISSVSTLRSRRPVPVVVTPAGRVFPRGG
jgi:CRISPR-associated endonuclease Csn1